MDSIKNLMTREKIQKITYRVLLGIIVCLVIAFLLKNEGFFFGIH